MMVSGYSTSSGSRRKPDVSVSITELPEELKASTSTTVAVDTFEKSRGVPQPVTFEPNPFAEPVVKPLAKLKTLLTDEDSDRRKAAASYFFQQAMGLKANQEVLKQTDALSSQDKQAVASAAKTIRSMDNLQKVQVMRDFTGEHSLYSRIAENLLINNKGLPQDSFRSQQPTSVQANASASQAGITALGIGLLMLPIVCPASLLFRPEFAGSLLGKLGIWAL